MKTGLFWSKRIYNPSNQNLGLEAQFESSDDESDTKDDRTKKPTSKKVVILLMGYWPILM